MSKQKKFTIEEKSNIILRLRKTGKKSDKAKD